MVALWSKNCFKSEKQSSQLVTHKMITLHLGTKLIFTYDTHTHTHTHTHAHTQYMKQEMKHCQLHLHVLFVYINADMQKEGLFLMLSLWTRVVCQSVWLCVCVCLCMHVSWTAGIAEWGGSAGWGLTVLTVHLHQSASPLPPSPSPLSPPLPFSPSLLWLGPPRLHQGPNPPAVTRPPVWLKTIRPLMAQLPWPFSQPPPP